MDDQLLAFAELLERWNQAFNLVSRRDVHRLQQRHIEDSLRLSSLLKQPGSVLDVGSGGGLPGMVLAIADPQRSFVLLDRSERKCRFLTQAVNELSIENVQVVCADIRSFKPEVLFTYVVSRAVATVDVLWNWAEPVLEKQGTMLHMTGDEQITERTKS